MERLAMVLKARLRAKKSGFTLVELLIVIMIIAILAGMLLLATGSATDTATATKIINDMRAAKSAALLIYMDSGQSWTWADSTATPADVEKSLDKYMDRPLFSGSDATYGLLLPGQKTINGGSGGTTPRMLIGFELKGAYGPGTNDNNARIKTKLAGNAARVGLYKSDGNTYDGSENQVYMVLN